MGINSSDWAARIASRSDLTGRLTHLTRPSKNLDLNGISFEDINLLAVDNLINILTEKKLNGSSREGYVIGSNKAVCFQDTPLYALVQNVEHERKRRDVNAREKLRYCGVGISFIKPDMYHFYGARQVFYEETEVAKSILPPEEWWRIVDNEYKLTGNDWDITDWTHEREWRVRGDMEFEYKKGYVHIVLYNPACVKRFLERCPKDILDQTYGITTLKSVLM
ncbi:hypothetical protein SAMN02799630_00217 [Paenibacillus sp. UNCCL117]|uniref:DUF2971 domain-containing protein n=1 Tax=unclassified Paenibacillus TaxID=185978 RepID=UPI00088DD113|nr:MULTISPECIES: DUF2971 domain-containing protein [unclassified Paenibacillus]SDC48019.1 hypothetical protein SAMN04488602_102314 [Paenibacillus sp. cl123]SFW12011.1 hypothetical protein SAMN02799630_00217 [Paenibacillus sp. UNCCL117]